LKYSKEERRISFFNNIKGEGRKLTGGRRTLPAYGDGPDGD
jgi:hypothetical protein